MRLRIALAALGLGLTVTACGGGGASSGPSGALPPTTSATPSPVAPPQQTTLSCVRSAPGVSSSAGPVVASGTVVDETSGAPLAGVPVALTAWAHGASALTAGSTDASGNFALSVSAPGQYLLVIGGNSGNDGCATMHLPVTLASGSNPIAGPVPSPAPPQVTYTPPQEAGALRIAALTSDEQSCLVGTNQGRAQNNLAPLIVDEQLLEHVRAFLQEEVAQKTDVPSPMYDNHAFTDFLFAFPGHIDMHSAQDYLGCAGWTSPSSSISEWSGPTGPSGPSNADSLSAANVWIGVTSTGYGPNSMFGAQMWEQDPRP